MAFSSPVRVHSWRKCPGAPCLWWQPHPAPMGDCISPQSWCRGPQTRKTSCLQCSCGPCGWHWQSFQAPASRWLGHQSPRTSGCPTWGQASPYFFHLWVCPRHCVWTTACTHMETMVSVSCACGPASVVFTSPWILHETSKASYSLFIQLPNTAADIPSQVAVHYYHRDFWLIESTLGTIGCQHRRHVFTCSFKKYRNISLQKITMLTCLSSCQTRGRHSQKLQACWRTQAWPSDEGTRGRARIGPSSPLSCMWPTATRAIKCQSLRMYHPVFAT